MRGFEDVSGAQDELFMRLSLRYDAWTGPSPKWEGH
jgi:hypothetical protein